jgi:hypothetical protein
MMGDWADAGPVKPSARTAMDAAIAKVRIISPFCYLGHPARGADPYAGCINSGWEAEPLLALSRAGIRRHMQSHSGEVR